MNRTFYKEIAFVDNKKDKERNYWLKKLSGNLVKSNFPYETNTTGPNQKSMDTVPFQLRGELLAKLLKLSSGDDYKLHMILTALLIVLINKYTGNNDIIVGSPIYKQDIEGEFINTILTLRNQLPKKMTFKELLLQVRQTIIEATENQNYPIEALLYHLKMPVIENEFPLFDIVIMVQNIHDKKYIQHIHPHMIFSFLRTDKSINGQLEYNLFLYKKNIIEKIIDHFTHLLKKFLFNVNLKAADVDLLAEEEKKQLLFYFNDTNTQYQNDKTLVNLFEEQVEKTPDNIALEAHSPGSREQSPQGAAIGYSAFTYRELNRKSNQLAHWLRKKKVKPDTIIGIMEDRSLEMIIGIFAILKAGGAYFPINLVIPRNRIVSMLEDSQSPIILAKNPHLDKYMFTILQGLRSSQLKPQLTSPRPPIQDLDDLPFPDRSLINYGNYNKRIGQSMANNNIVIQATRGCPYHCAYCHKTWPKKHVYRSAENIFKEVMLNYDLGVRKFAFVDDIFNLNRKNSENFFKLIIKHNLDVQFYFPNGLRGDLMTREYIDLMIEAGTVSFALALETASPRLQKVIGKNLNLKKFQENIHYVCSQYPQLILELFTMHGFPGETKEEAAMTLEFIKNLRWIHFPYVNILKIYPNTDMEKIALANGISRESIINSENYAHFEISDNSPFEENFTLKYRSDFLNNYFLLKERLLHVLSYQMKVLTEDELVQKYNSYLPTEINCFDDLLRYLEINKNELKRQNCKAENSRLDFSLNLAKKKKSLFKEPAKSALRILLMDLSQFFSSETDFFYDVEGEAPLGLMYLLTYLYQQLGSKINGKIIKSRIDFDSYAELKVILDEFKPDVIGVRSLSIYKDFFHQTLSIIKQWGIDVPVIAGGPYATADYTTILQDRNVDLVVRGEGEITFNEVIHAILENRGKLPPAKVLKKIPGIAFMPGDAKTIEDNHREIIIVDELKEVLANEPDSNPEPVNRTRDLAYIMFTSGSLGKPKGVMVQHGNVNNLLLGLRKKIYEKYDEKLKIALVAPFAFDASVKQILGALFLGNCLHIVPEDIRVDGESLLQYYSTYQIDISDGTPTHIRLMLESGVENFSYLSLKHLIIGGEALPGLMTDRFLKRFKTNAPKITNIYGLTECTVDTTLYEIAKENILLHHWIPIGKPMPNTRVYIVNRENQLQPLGLAGELCIAGEGVTRGYLNKPELTAKKFCLRQPGVQYPIIPLPHHLIYRTGDLARWQQDGNIEFLGRIDRQIKVRGYRIELGEIESHLIKHKEVKSAVVLARDDNDGDKYLCAYIVSIMTGSVGEGESLQVIPGKDKEQAVEIKKLKADLSKELPDYMIPSSFVQLNKIPLTSNGKIDREALPEPEPGLGEEYGAPRDILEEKMAAIWWEVLGIEQEKIGIDADFFELGGHSLKATILISKIHKEFDVKVPLREIFKTPTIRRLSRYIKKTKKEKHYSLRAAEKKDYYELSSAQKRLYFMQQIDLNSSCYNLFLLLRLEGRLVRKRLEETFVKLIKRHESLRTSFEIVDGKPMQKIHQDVHFTLNNYEMNEQEAREFGEGKFIKAFDLSKAPLMRAGLAKVGEDRYVLMVNLHHIISDGTSQGMLMKEFIDIYKEEKLPSLKIQYKDFSEWQNSRKQSESVKKQEKYWIKQFEGEIPELRLPTDYERPAVKNFEGNRIQFFIHRNEKQRIKELSLKEDATLYMFMLAVYTIFLYKITGQEDIVVGSPLAGRRHTDLEPLIGMFVNALAMRNYPFGDKSCKQFLREVRKRTLEAFENQDYQFEDLVAKVVKKNDQSRNPLFNALITLQNMEMPTIEVKKLKFSSYNFLGKVSRFDLGFIVQEIEDRLSIVVEYSTKLFKEQTIRRFIRNFQEIITAVLEDVDICLKDINITHGLVKLETEVELSQLGFNL